MTKDGKKLLATAGSYTKKRRDIVVPEGVEEICQLSLTSDIRHYYQGSDRWGSYRGGGTYYISRSEVNGVEFGVVEGDYWGEEISSDGAVNVAFYEPGASKATGTASATLMPYNRDGDIVEALLTIAIAPKGRHSLTLALYLEMDTSHGVVYGDDIEVVDYLMEAE